MENKFTDEELIDGHLRDDLSAEMLEFFEARLADDSFKQKLEDDTQWVQKIKHLGRQELSSQLATWYGEAPSAQRRVLPRKWLIAAGVITFISASIWMLFSLNQPSLFKSHFVVLPDYISQAIRSQKSDRSAYADLMIPYNNQDFEVALKGFETYLDIYPDDPKVQLYYGVTLLQLSRFRESKEILEAAIQDSEDPTFYQPIQWYLLLNYLALNRKDQAQELASSIGSTADHYKQEEAKRLLEKISE